MKFLNDRIIVTVNTNTNALSGMYQYRVMRNEDSETIFVGNFYYKQGESRYTFDITDIVRSDVQPLTLDKFDMHFNYDEHINSYTVYVVINDTTTSNSTDFICKSYVYPNYNDITAPDMFFDTEDETERISILQQGHYKSNLADNYWDVLPIFPCYADGADWTNSNFPFWFATECGRDVDEVVLYGQARDNQTYYDLFEDYQYTSGRMNLNYWSRLSDVCTRIIQSNNISSFKFWISPTDFVEYDEGEVFAIGNECLNKRYFLVWQDRLGSMMSKPFNDFTEYSESFEKEAIEDYTNTRKLNIVSVQPKWKISSGWIKEVLYPLYESIYVSPILFLYDMKYNKCYNVIVKGDYTEKTYRNQKKLINITLELEETNKQKILY